MSAQAGHGASVRIEACGKTLCRRNARARTCNARHRPWGKRWCCSAPPAAARPPCCASSRGLEVPDTGGRVLFDGKDMTAVPIERRNVGMVFQSYALFPNMSVVGQYRLLA